MFAGSLRKAFRASVGGMDAAPVVRLEPSIGSWMEDSIELFGEVIHHTLIISDLVNPVTVLEHRVGLLSSC